MNSTPFHIQERVRWIDCDGARIIYYGAYVRFFEIAETEMYRSIGLPYVVAFQTIDGFPVRAAYHCEYYSPARLDDLMDIDIWVSHWGTTSYIIGFEFARAETGERLAGGYCRIVMVDLIDKRPIPIPDILRDGLARYTQEGRVSVKNTA